MRSFTFVEVMVSAVITSIIGAALFLVLSVSYRSWFTGDATISLRQGIVGALMTMDRELRSTTPSKTNLVTGIAQNSLTFYLPNDNNNDGSIITDTGAIEWSVVPITYSLSSQQLVRTSAGASRSFASNVVGLIFTRIDDRVIQVDITVRRTDNSGRIVQDTEQAIIKMRN